MREEEGGEVEDVGETSECAAEQVQQSRGRAEALESTERAGLVSHC